MRPPGPEPESERCDSLAALRTGSHPLDITADRGPADPLNAAPGKPCEAGFVPIVSPSSPPNFVLPERLLTIREAAALLRVSRATLYKLCSQDQVAHVRVGNAIRFAPEDLSAFLRTHSRR